MKLRIISVAKTKEEFILAGEAEYLKRLKRWCQLEIDELGIRSAASMPPSQVLDREGDAIIKSLRKAEQLVVLDEHGKSYTSLQLGSWLESGLQHHPQGISFVIGGAYGLSPRVKERANLLLALSTMTFTYQMSRLILIEQLYRAFANIHAIPYHKQ